MIVKDLNYYPSPNLHRMRDFDHLPKDVDHDHISIKRSFFWLSDFDIQDQAQSSPGLRLDSRVYDVIHDVVTSTCHLVIVHQEPAKIQNSF